MDFKVKGTKLPYIPEGTQYRCKHWHGGCLDLGSSYHDLVSYGVDTWQGIEYILAERPNYSDQRRLYMFPVSEIERLAAEQNMVPTPLTELPKYWVVKRDITNPDWRKVINYINERHDVSFAGDYYEYYGYDGSNGSGVDGHDRLYLFENQPTELTIAEFVRLTTQKQEAPLTELPTYWVVRCDTKHLDWMKVIDYLYKTHGEKWSGHSHGAYYGYDGNDEYNGTNTYGDLSRFANNPTLLTIEEFLRLTKLKQQEMAKSNATLTELPEYWVVKQDVSNPGWKLVMKYLNDKSGYAWEGNAYNYYGTEPNCDKNVNCYDRLSSFKNNPTLLTIEEFLRLTNQKPETMITIKREQLFEIHNVACSAWKEKITDIAKRQPFGDISLTQPAVDEMFKAANADQKVVLEQIFGKQEKIDMDAILRQIEVRKNHNLAGVSFFLPHNYTWKIVTDSNDVQCLVPTKK